MILTLILGCVSLDEAKAGAQEWIGPAGRVQGCRSSGRGEPMDTYFCDVEKDGARTRLVCDPSCVEAPSW